MATTTERVEEVAAAFAAVEGELGDLPSILEDEQQGQLSEGEWLTRSMEWGQAISFLRFVLDPAYRAGQMTPSQTERYRQLLQALQDALPLLQRLGFTLPQISLQP